jgi:hypothetical protein
VVVIWVQRFEETGSVAAKPSGGSTSPLEQYAEFLLGLIADQPDLGRWTRSSRRCANAESPAGGVRRPGTAARGAHPVGGPRLRPEPESSARR